MKKLYLYLSIALAFTLTLALFKFVFLKEDVVQKIEPTVEENTTSGYVSLPKSEGSEVKYTGKVIPIRPGIYQEGTHELVDENEKIIAFLKASDAKLTLAEGQLVEVKGKLGKASENGIPVLTVSSIIFK